jgi:hypothetical protein
MRSRDALDLIGLGAFRFAVGSGQLIPFGARLRRVNWELGRTSNVAEPLGSAAAIPAFPQWTLCITTHGTEVSPGGVAPMDNRRAVDISYPHRRVFGGRGGAPSSSTSVEVASCRCIGNDRAEV